MLVKHLLSRKGKNIQTVKPGVSVQNAARLMAKNNFGAIVISSDGRKPEGIISERDITRGIGKTGSDFLRYKVGDVCFHKVVTCTPSDDIYRVMNTMNKGRFRHMPVTNNGVLIGMISIVDILREQMSKKELA